MVETIHYTSEDRIAYLTIDNSRQHNALGREELRAMQEVIQEVNNSDSIRALVLTGSGDKTFCAGASLKQLDSGEITPEYFQATTVRLASVKVPTICALNGSVFGGGVELALSCDFRIGVQGSIMRVPAAAIGLCYPLSGIEKLVSTLGINAARSLLLATEKMDAEEMLEVGFLDRLTTRDELQQHVDALAQRLATGAPLAVQAMKQILNQAYASGVQVEKATALASRCAMSSDLKEGLRAQLEKRAPKFTGK